jgi:hypothetical protein
MQFDPLRSVLRDSCLSKQSWLSGVTIPFYGSFSRSRMVQVSWLARPTGFFLALAPLPLSSAANKTEKANLRSQSLIIRDGFASLLLFRMDSHSLAIPLGKTA